ncbi:MAG: tetratricopeptide repeat protein [Caldilineaceae bacterium]|nr:tetratricopeptide repeat protein [Caldilineaceae bacterium]
MRAQGRLRDAIRIYEDALQLATTEGEPALPGAADLYAGLSELLCEQGDLESAEASLLKSKELGKHASLPEMQYRSRTVVMARLKQAQGDLDAAIALLSKAEPLFVRGPVPDVRPISALRARLWITQGNLADALRWASEKGLSADEEISYLR